MRDARAEQCAVDLGRRLSRHSPGAAVLDRGRLRICGDALPRRHWRRSNGARARLFFRGGAVGRRRIPALAPMEQHPYEVTCGGQTRAWTAARVSVSHTGSRTDSAPPASIRRVRSGPNLHSGETPILHRKAIRKGRSLASELWFGVCLVSR